MRDKLLGLAYKILLNADDSEDATQEVMMKLWNLRQQLDSCRNIEAFAMTLMHNTCIDMKRTEKRHLQIDTLDINFEMNFTPSFELKDEVELIKKIIHSLPEIQQRIIQMKDVEGYENEEIAEITGSNIEAIRSNLSRARKKVRDIYLGIIKRKN